LLTQSEVLNHEVGAAVKHRPDETDADDDEKEENMEHSGGLCPSRGVIS
jgi:hypothetical protein